MDARKSLTSMAPAAEGRISRGGRGSSEPPPNTTVAARRPARPRGRGPAGGGGSGCDGGYRRRLARRLRCWKGRGESPPFEVFSRFVSRLLGFWVPAAARAPLVFPPRGCQMGPICHPPGPPHLCTSSEAHPATDPSPPHSRQCPSGAAGSGQGRASRPGSLRRGGLGPVAGGGGGGRRYHWRDFYFQFSHVRR